MTELIARIAVLKTTPTPDLQAQWRELFETEPPRRNRGYLESRIAYRIQELEHGGLAPATVARLERLGDELDGGDATVRKRRVDDRPVAGTRLIREIGYPLRSRDVNMLGWRTRHPIPKAGSTTRAP